MFLKLLIISSFLVIISFLFFSIKLIMKRNGRFPETHISRNREMQKRGISCALKTDIGCSPDDDISKCDTCGRVIH